MKKITVPALAFALVLLIAAGCKKSNDNGSGSSGIGATVAGTAWQSQLVVGLAPSDDSFIFLTGFYGKAGDTTLIELDISDTTHIGQADPFSGSSVSYTKSNGTTYSGEDFWGGHGSITVTSWDKNAHKIAGTFNGVFYNTQNSDDSIVMANGHFNTSYIVQ